MDQVDSTVSGVHEVVRAPLATGWGDAANAIQLLRIIDVVHL